MITKLDSSDYPEKDLYMSLTTEQLSEKAKQALMSGDTEKGQKILDIIKVKKEGDNSKPLVQATDDLAKKYNKLIEKFDEKKPKKKGKEYKEWLENRDKEVQNFFEDDIKKYTGDIKENTKKLTAAKDEQIKDLQDRLNETLMTSPELGEYLSLKRRKLVTISTHFKNFKEEDEKNYPKNFFIYAMALTNTSVFGTREKLNRAKVKLLWNKNSNDINGKIGVLKERIKINTDDKPWTKALKMQIADQLEDARKAHVKKEAENVGLAA